MPGSTFIHLLQLLYGFSNSPRPFLPQGLCTDCSHHGCMTFSVPLALCANKGLPISLERPSQVPGLKNYSQSIRLNSLSYCAFFLAFNTTWYCFPCLFPFQSACFIPDTDTVWIVKCLRSVHRDGNRAVACNIQHKTDTSHIGHHIRAPV